MSNANELARGHKRLQPLIEFALNEGWEVTRTCGGHLKFVKPGLPPIFTGSTTSDLRTGSNIFAMLLRAQRQAETNSPNKRGTDYA